MAPVEKDGPPIKTLMNPKPLTILGGSWVVISGVLSLLIWVISIGTLLITTHEAPSRP